MVYFHLHFSPLGEFLAVSPSHRFRSCLKVSYLSPTFCWFDVLSLRRCCRVLSKYEAIQKITRQCNLKHAMCKLKVSPYCYLIIPLLFMKKRQKASQDNGFTWTGHVCFTHPCSLSAGGFHLLHCLSFAQMAEVNSHYQFLVSWYLLCVPSEYSFRFTQFPRFKLKYSPNKKPKEKSHLLPCLEIILAHLRIIPKIYSDNSTGKRAP